MSVLVALAIGAVLGQLAHHALRGVLADPLFARENHRGLVVATAVGLVLPVAAAVAAALVALAAAGGLGVPGASAARQAVLLVVTGLALVGLVDDLAARAVDGRGFRGHLGALAGGRFTSGGLKLVGGSAVAMAACAPISGDGVARLVGDALLVALAANLGNLFDRAPGRSLKVAAVAFSALALGAGLAPALAGVAVVVGAALALLPGDLAERSMLGDTGANALGGVLGLGVVLATAPATRVGVLAAVAALNLAGELVSFSRVIEAVAPLRALDQAGRTRDGP